MRIYYSQAFDFRTSLLQVHLNGKKLNDQLLLRKVSLEVINLLGDPEWKLSMKWRMNLPYKQLVIRIHSLSLNLLNKSLFLDMKFISNI